MSRVNTSQVPRPSCEQHSELGNLTRSTLVRWVGEPDLPTWSSLRGATDLWDAPLPDNGTQNDTNKMKADSFTRNQAQNQDMTIVCGDEQETQEWGPVMRPLPLMFDEGMQQAGGEG